MVEKVDVVDEIDAVGALIRSAFSDVAERLNLTRENSPHFPAFIENEKLLHQLDRPEVRCLGIRMEGMLIGFVAVAPFGDSYEITRLAVDPAYRHKGYGSALMDAACDAAREWGLTRIHLGLVNENTVLKKWYEAQGFEAGAPFKIPNAAFTTCPMSKDL